MKRTISIAALTLGASATFAFVGPHSPGDWETKTFCLNAYEADDGAIMLGSCDETFNNLELNRELNSQGCAPGQAALHVSKHTSVAHFSPEIRPCLPPNVAQL